MVYNQRSIWLFFFFWGWLIFLWVTCERQHKRKKERTNERTTSTTTTATNTKTRISIYLLYMPSFVKFFLNGSLLLLPSTPQNSPSRPALSKTPPTNRDARSQTIHTINTQADDKEVELDVALECVGGVHLTGLVLQPGPDGLLEVAKIRPGGTATGVLAPGDVIVGCSLVVMVEDEEDTGEYVPDRRWHDARDAAPEHTLAVIMTHGDGGTALELRVCRNYVPKLNKSIRSPWNDVVPTTISRDVRETWTRLFFKPKKNRTAFTRVLRPELLEDEEVEEEVEGIGGIWSSLMVPRRGPLPFNSDSRCEASQT